MGAIAPSKMPKARTEFRKDGDGFKKFAKGGKVRRFKEGGFGEDMAQDVAKRQKREDSSGLRFEGGGGKNEYATSIGGRLNYDILGGRLNYDIPAGEDSTISPYIEGFVAKPKGGKRMGEATGAGVMYKKRFKSGGLAQQAATAIAMKEKGIKPKKMASGGALKEVPDDNAGLGKLPTEVRNKMGYMKEGGQAKSKVNAAGNYTKPGLRKRIFNSVKAAAIVGTGAGQWSARKAQVMAKRYKAAGGSYRD